MAYERDCKQCGNRFEANRQDAIFCSGKCTAKYYRDNPNPDYTHAAKEHVHWFVCDECGQGYVINDYAVRGGKRAPRFCSVKCKQKAYRGRVKQQAARRQEQTAQPGTGQSERQRQQKQDDQRQQRQRTQRRSSRMTYHEALDFMGLKHGYTAAELKKAYKTLALKYHPDKNQGNEAWATDMFQRLGNAYDTLKSVT